MERESKDLDENDRLKQLVSDYYELIGKGCLPALGDILTGKSMRRTELISQLSGFGDAKDVTKLFGSVNLICLGSQTKEEALQKLQEAFMKGTRGGQRTGNATTDRKIENSARLARMALDNNWKIRERRLSERSQKPLS